MALRCDNCLTAEGVVTVSGTYADLCEECQEALQDRNWQTLLDRKVEVPTSRKKPGPKPGSKRRKADPPTVALDTRVEGTIKDDPWEVAEQELASLGERVDLPR